MVRYLFFQWNRFKKPIVAWFKKQVALYRFLQEIESYAELQKKYNYQVVLLYHARCAVTAETWLTILKRCEAQPTLDSILEDKDKEGEDKGDGQT